MLSVWLKKRKKYKKQLGNQKETLEQSSKISSSRNLVTKLWKPIVIMKYYRRVEGEKNEGNKIGPQTEH